MAAAKFSRYHGDIARTQSVTGPQRFPLVFSPAWPSLWKKGASVLPQEQDCQIASKPCLPHELWHHLVSCVRGYGVQMSSLFVGCSESNIKREEAVHNNEPLGSINTLHGVTPNVIIK